MQIIKEIEQRTEAWRNLRRGRLTASNASIIIANGKGLESYCYEIIADYYSKVEKPQITNTDIERGNELEPIARSLYEYETGQEVTEIACCIVNDYISASPDGVIYKGDKIVKSIEIKCPKDTKYLNVLLNGYIDPVYYCQMQMQMYCLETDIVDYVCYNPHFDKDLIIIPVKRDEETIKKLEIGLETGTKILKELHERIQKIRSL